MGYPESAADAPDVLLSPEAGRRVVRGSIQRVAGYGLGVALTGVASILMLHHLSLEDFGRYATVMAVLAIVSGLADAGLTIVGNRELALLPPGEPRRRLLGTLVGIRLTLTPIGVALGVLFGLAAGYDDTLVTGIAVAGAGVVLLSAQATYQSLPAVELRNVRVTANDVMRQLFMLIAVAVLVASGAALSGFFAAQVAIGIGMVAVAPLVLGRRAITRPRFDAAQWRRLLAQGIPVAAAYMLALIYFRVLLLLLSLSSDAIETGIFGTSLRVFELLLGFPTLAVGVALPVLAASRANPARLRYQVDRLIQGSVVLGALVTLFVVIGAQPIIEILGGDEYAPAAGILRLHVLAFTVVFVSNVASTTLIALRHQRAVVIGNGIGLVIMVALGLVLVVAADGGATEAAYAAIAGELALMALLLVALGRSQVPLSSPVWLWRVALATAAGAVPAFVPGVGDLVAAVLAVVVFCAVALTIRAVPDDIAQAIRRPPGSPPPDA